MSAPDLLAENAKLRAEVEKVTKREADGVALFDGIVAELRAELTEARAALAKMKEAPSEVEVAAWRQGAEMAPLDEESIDRHRNEETGAYVIYGKEIEKAVALMRRAQSAPSVGRS